MNFFFNIIFIGFRLIRKKFGQEILRADLDFNEGVGIDGFRSPVHVMCHPYGEKNDQSEEADCRNVVFSGHFNRCLDNRKGQNYGNWPFGFRLNLT